MMMQSYDDKFSQMREQQRQEKRDTDYIALAKFWALRKSKDPSRQCCAVVVRPDGTIVSMGYNGFPMGIADTEERLNDRAQKHPRVVHAEINALILAREPLHGYTLYQWPGCSCSNCASVMIQAGIKRVVNPFSEVFDTPRYGKDDWRHLLVIAREMFAEAGVQHDEIEFDE